MQLEEDVLRNPAATNATNYQTIPKNLSKLIYAVVVVVVVDVNLV